MSLAFHWFLPTHGDSRYPPGTGHRLATGVAVGNRPATLAYLGQIARSAEQLGYVGVLTPTGAWCEDDWLVDAMLAETTDSLKFLAALRPGLVSPTLAAQMAATFQRHSGGRLLLNVVADGESGEQRAHGDFLEQDERYARADEFLQIVRALWRGESVSFDGSHLRVEKASISRVPDPPPPLYLGGASPLGNAVAAKHSDVYMTGGESLGLVADKVDRVRTLAAAEGRRLRFGIRLHVITRDSAEAAWSRAERLLTAQTATVAIPVRDHFPRLVTNDDLGIASRRMGPNLWTEAGLTRDAAGAVLVGSHQEVAERIREYAAVGVDEFILSGFPHLEEAYWFAEGVLPQLEKDGLWRHPLAAASGGIPFDIPFAAAADISFPPDSGPA